MARPRVVDPSGEDLVQIGIKIPAELYEKLKYHCYMERIPYADLVREFLNEVLKDVDPSVGGRRSLKPRTETLGFIKRNQKRAA